MAKDRKVTEKDVGNKKEKSPVQGTNTPTLTRYDYKPLPKFKGCKNC